MKRILFLAAILACACSQKKPQLSKADLKAEIIKAETDFNRMAQQKGIAEAFFAFADSDAIIKRENDTLIEGPDHIRNYYRNQISKNASVTWKPDFVEVSEDGTLGYTYGKYVWTVRDTVGKSTESKGVFHTVWKKQKDGSWKYVWD